MPEFSESQKQVIDLRDCNILVSAAAGSGKTTVLVERIIRRILDPVDPIDIDQLLVLTFTKAAAGEMRERIADAIVKQLEKDPENEHLKKQSVLIYNAQINTIDSFCLSILKNNFTEIGLEPGFRNANEAEMTIICDQVLDDTMEEILSKKDIPYLDEFLNRFESKDSIRKIKDAILANYNEAEKAPFIEDYLEYHKKDYEVESVEELKETDWFGILEKEIKTKLTGALEQVNILGEYVDNVGPVEYEQIVVSDRETVEELISCESYEELGRRISMVAWDTLPRKTSCEEIEKKHAQNIRKLYKDIINDLSEKYFCQSLEDIVIRMKETSKVVSALMDATLLYHHNLEREKRTRGIITFADMEHMALQILLDKVDGQYVPSRVALDMRECYKELMIDEYQDSNYIQEALIHSISGENEGRFDRFMVGDVKQSIYRFRNANPKLFMEKYNSYTKDDGNCRRIDLSSNYRSRASVLDFTNTVFERIMDTEIGGVEYDKDSRLYTGASFAAGDMDTTAEILLISPDKESEYTDEENEARLIADRILNMVGSYQVQDKDTKELRACTYRDIVVLLRSTGHLADAIKRIFDIKGIPAYITSKSGYFKTSEIVTLLNYLRIIDNPYNDIEMYGSLTSVFGGFDENELALIKILNRDSLYEGLECINNTDESGIFSEHPELNGIDISKLKNKTEAFLSKLNAYRKMVPYTPIHDLLRRILRDSRYYEYIIALPMGLQREANVNALLGKAEGFEGNGFKGLFNFVTYIEQLKKYDSDEGEVVTLDENADLVRIMTMHKSKGLEFPVCILAGLSKKINHMDENSEIVYHEQYGIGFDYVDSVKRAKFSDLRKRFIAGAIRKEGLSEEMRVLYVAMTRAKEKLVMTAVSDKSEEELKSLETGRLLPYSTRIKFDSFFDMIMGSRCADDWNGQCRISYFTPDSLDDSMVADVLNSIEIRRGFEDTLKQFDSESEEVKELASRIDFNYSHSYLKDLYTKTSVSELKMAAMHEILVDSSDEEGENRLFDHDSSDTYIPSFIDREVEENGGALRGSAYHRLMELVDFTCINRDITENDIEAQAKKLIESGRLTLEEYGLVDKRKIVGFSKTSLAERMSRAAQNKDLFLEQPFVLGINADRLNKDFDSEETVLIQGIIDAYFIEDGEIVLMDYKTDSVKSEEELIKRYITQLDYYEEALNRITNMKVKERIIYSFALGKEIQL